MSIIKATNLDLNKVSFSDVKTDNHGRKMVYYYKIEDNFYCNSLSKDRELYNHFLYGIFEVPKNTYNKGFLLLGIYYTTLHNLEFI